MSADLYAQITARVVAALEQGVAPWVRPWSTGIDTLPINASSRRPYRGVNVVLLALEAQARGYPLNRFLTYKQAAELGGHVRKGEKGSTVVFWKLRQFDAAADAYPQSHEEHLPERVIPLLRSFVVFNVAQIDNLPVELLATAMPAWEPEAKAEELLVMSNADIHYGGSEAFYHPADDFIQLPPRQAFPSAHSFYGTGLHELIHWTSHSSRCDRKLGKRFGDAAYAAEELIAEIGSAFLCAHARLDGQLQHASYVDHWLRILRRDKRAVFVASSKSQQAADYLLALTRPANAS